MSMASMTWWDYVRAHGGDLTDRQLSKKVGITSPTLTRWRNGARTDGDTAAKVARILGANPISALAAAGTLKNEEIEGYKDTFITAQEIPTNQLIAELTRRIVTLQEENEKFQEAKDRIKRIEEALGQ